MLFDIPALLPDPLSGTRYRLGRLLGTGTSSEVFEATGPEGHRFALKVLRQSSRDSREMVARIVREARVLSTIQHPNLMPVYDIGVTHDGRPFFVMPRIEGQTLQEYLAARGPMEPALAASLMAGALEGLHETHCRGIVHRDVKPGNIFLVMGKDKRPERALMFDFGIAKLTNAAAQQTTGNRILGTPRYIAPEQILGGRIDARADVYAMAIVLFECIAARGPYDVLRGAEFAEHMHAHLALAPKRLDDLSPASPALASVIARGLEKRPSKRHRTALAFAAALERAMGPAARRASTTLRSAGGAS